MTANHFYPIGSAGRAWEAAERAEWRARQQRRRSYDDDVLSRIAALGDHFERIDYGTLAYDGETYTLQAARSGNHNPLLPSALITGGVHGYETSGITGALAFLENHAEEYAGRINMLVVPCVSPWAYERVQRWNHDAIDPNRNFRTDGPAREATALIDLVRSVSDRYLVHVDLHETTDSDRTEFGPALCARDGKSLDPYLIPDGFYLVADSANPQLAFQEAVIAAVEKVAPIAHPDATGEIIGSPVIARGAIAYSMAELGLCGSIANARFATTTEVYPDAPGTTSETCVETQVNAICAALDFALRQYAGSPATDDRS